MRIYQAHHFPGIRHLDGKLNKAPWTDCAWSDDFVDIEGDIRSKPRFRTRMPAAGATGSSWRHGPLQRWNQGHGNGRGARAGRGRLAWRESGQRAARGKLQPDRIEFGGPSKSEWLGRGAAWELDGDFEAMTQEQASCGWRVATWITSGILDQLTRMQTIQLWRAIEGLVAQQPP